MGVPMVLPLDNFRKYIEGAYFSNMSSSTTSYNIPPRGDRMCLQDLHRDSDNVNLKVADLERWCARFHEAIDNGYCVDVSSFNLDKFCLL